MNNKPIEQQVELELNRYFDCSKKIKCPASMKKNLYKHISEEKQRFSLRFIVVGLSLVFVTSVVFNISNNRQNHQNTLHQAQSDLQIAMHYMNRVSFKSLSSVTNKGIKPALIIPMAKSVAAL